MEVGAGKWGGGSNPWGWETYLLVVEDRGREAEMGCGTLLMQLLFILLFTWEINGFSHTTGPSVPVTGFWG